MVDDSRTQIENDSVGAYHFFVSFGTDGNIIPRQKKQIEKILASGVPKWAITIYIGSEDCELPYSVDELIAIGALEETKKTLTTSTETKKTFQSTLYATRKIEPRPNHAAVSDLLRILPYPNKWKDYGIELGTAQIIHSKERYVQYELFGMDSTGDFIPITPESTQDVVGSFDWIDHKILSVLLMRSFESGGNKFVLSLNWLATLITDDRKVKKDPATGKREPFSRKKLLHDLERRIKRLRMLFLQVKWHEGQGKSKKIFNLLVQEGIERIEFSLFLIPSIWEEKNDKKHDIFSEIEPGKWYQLFCKNLRQFTWIPKELLEINTHNNWRRYAIGEYILIEYRSSVDDLKEVTDYETKQPIKVLHRKLDTLIREILTPEEINYALTNRDKGWRLKTAILDDFEYYRSCGWYVGLQFPEGGFQEFLSGFVDTAPDPANAQAIQKALDSRPEPKKLPSRRKPSNLTGEQIRAARIAKGWTQRDLVKNLDAYVEVSQRKISFWESDKTQPTPKEAAKLKYVLGIKD
jgi:DNA-binding transcriptional regulator YiaG